MRKHISSVLFAICIAPLIASAQQESNSIAIENEYLVRKAPGVDEASFANSLSSAMGRKVTLVENLKYDQLYRVRLEKEFYSKNDEEKAKSLVSDSFALASVDNVVRLEPLVSFRLADISSDHTRATIAVKQIMQRVGLPSLISSTHSNPAKPVIVAVIDSGVALDHEVFDGLLLPGIDVTLGANNPPNTRPAEAKLLPNGNPETHGTSVAGLIALAVRGGILNGAPIANVKILPIRATTLANGVERILSSDAIKAVDAAIANGASFINASWGDNADSGELKKTFSQADTANVVIVTAAGNGRRKNIFDDYEGYDIDMPGDALYPACWRMPNMLAVAALDPDEQLAGFSNWGKSSVQIAAPGVAVISPVSNKTMSLGKKIRTYQASDGTSLAAPLVTGILSIYSARNPTLNNRALVNRVIASALRSNDLKSKIKSSGRLSGFQLIGLKETPVLASSQASAGADVAPISEGSALALVRDRSATVQVSDAPILTTLDDAGNYVKSDREVNFLIRTSPNKGKPELNNSMTYGLGNVTDIQKVKAGLYSVSVEAVGSSKAIENKLKKVPGVHSVEKEASFKLQ